MEILELFHKNTLFSLSQRSGYCACIPCALCRFVGVLLEKCDFLYFILHGQAKNVCVNSVTHRKTKSRSVIANLGLLLLLYYLLCSIGAMVSFMPFKNPSLIKLAQ